MHCGGGEVIVAVGIYKATGGINLTCKNIGNRIGTCNTETAYPQASVNIIIVEEVNFECVGSVDENNDLGNFACCLELVNVPKKFSLTCVEFKIVLCVCFAFIAGERAIVALTAYARECKNNCITVCGDGVLNVCGIFVDVDFEDRSLTCENCTFAGRRACFFFKCFQEILSLITVVPIPKGLVYCQAGLFKCCLEVVCFGSIYVTGTGAAVCEVYRVCGKCTYLGACSKRKCIVFVEQKCCAFCFYFVAKFVTGSNSVCFGSVIALVVDGIGILILECPEGVAGNEERDCVVKHSDNNIHGNHNDHENDQNDRHELDEFHNVSPFCRNICVLFFTLRKSTHPTAACF